MCDVCDIYRQNAQVNKGAVGNEMQNSGYMICDRIDGATESFGPPKSKDYEIHVIHRKNNLQ